MFNAELDGILRELPKWHRQTHQRIEALKRAATQSAVDALIDELKKAYGQEAGVQIYLASLEKDVIENADDLRRTKQGDEESPLGALIAVRSPGQPASARSPASPAGKILESAMRDHVFHLAREAQGVNHESARHHDHRRQFVSSGDQSGRCRQDHDLKGILSMNDIMLHANAKRGVVPPEIVSTLKGICEHRHVRVGAA